MSERDWLVEFSMWLREQELAERTMKSYLGALGVFAAWFERTYGRPFSPRQLTARDVQTYKHELQQIRKLKASTVNISLAMLRTVAKWCMSTGALVEDPAAVVSFAELAVAPPRWLTRAELRKLLAEFERDINHAEARQAPERASQGRRDLAIVTLMAGAGLRIGETLDLDLGDIEFKHKPKGGKALIRNGKGGLQREAYFGPEAYEALAAWLAVRGRAAGALFTSQKGGRLKPRTFQSAFAERAHKAGLEEATPHSLRHYFGKRLIDNNEPITKVARLMGHRRIQTTARYAEPGQAELAAAAEGLF